MDSPRVSNAPRIIILAALVATGLLFFGLNKPIRKWNEHARILESLRTRGAIIDLDTSLPERFHVRGPLLSLTLSKPIAVRWRERTLTDTDLRNTAHLTSLTDLKIYRCSFNPSQLAASLKSLPNLRNFELTGSQLNSGTAQNLAILKNLQRLHIWRCTGDDIDFARACAGGQLHYLDLSECPIGLATVQAIGRQTGLWLLYLDDTPLSDSHLSYFTNLTALRHLRLSLTLVTGENFALFRSLPELRSLSLAGCKLKPDTYPHFLTLVNLRSLDLSDTPITEMEASAIAMKPGLKELRLRNTALATSFLKELQRSHPKLNVDGGFR